MTKSVVIENAELMIAARCIFGWSQVHASSLLRAQITFKG